jgi:hypothetical protein
MLLPIRTWLCVITQGLYELAIHRDGVELTKGGKLIDVLAKLKYPVIAYEPKPKIATTAIKQRVDFW